jgi:hypothetical protein
VEKKGGKNASEYRKIIDSISNPYPFLGLKEYYYSILSFNVFQSEQPKCIDFHYIYHHVQSFSVSLQLRMQVYSHYFISTPIYTL